MGRFLKYETSNARTFVINAIDKTIKRPNRRITKEDLLGAIVEVKGDGEDIYSGQSIISYVGEIQGNIIFTFHTGTRSMSGEYLPLEDTFTIALDGGTEGPVTYTNIFVDSFGRVVTG